MRPTLRWRGRKASVRRPRSPHVMQGAAMTQTRAKRPRADTIEGANRCVTAPTGQGG